MPSLPGNESAVLEMNCGKVAATTGIEDENNELLPELLIKYGPDLWDGRDGEQGTGLLFSFLLMSMNTEGLRAAECTEPDVTFFISLDPDISPMRKVM